MSHLFPNETRIHEILECSKENVRDYALLQLAASTALRGVDILRLKRKDVIDTDGEIIRNLRLKQKKTGRYIERPLRDGCRGAIKDWLDCREDKNPYLFCSLSNRNLNSNTKPINRATYHRVMKKYLARFYPASTLQGASTHTLRRAVAKLVYKKTGEIAAAQALLGHSSPVNTSRYIDQEEIMERADKVIHGLEF